MRSALFLATAITLLLRGGAALRLTARRGQAAVMDFVSRFQPVIARKLFWTAGFFGGLRTAFERPRMALPPTFLIVSNHQSLADIPALAITFSRWGLRYVAKRELARGLPYISPSLRMGEHALISRKGHFREGQDAMKRLADLGTQGICPVVFPEGTRSKTGRVNEFFAGAMRVMLERQPLPVLSVALDGGYRIATVPRLITGTRGTTYRVRPLALHPAPHGKKEIQELIARTHAEIKAQVDEWRAQEKAR